MDSKRIYLDHAAGTPLDGDVHAAMQPYLTFYYGNPSALYYEGVLAKEALDSARASIAQILKARSHEVVFTASGTESDNLAIEGVVRALLRDVAKPHVIISEVEHPAVNKIAESLHARGVIDLSYLPVDKLGVVDPSDVQSLLRDETVLVSVMYANSEVGTVQPIRQIARTVKSFREKKSRGYPYMHTDACQAMNYEPIGIDYLGVDLMTFNGSKIYGPRGVGVLYVHKDVSIDPILLGGGQEGGLRPGTENVANVVGLAAALEKTRSVTDSERERLLKLQSFFFEQLEHKAPCVHINGDRFRRIPNNVHISVSGMEEDVMVIELDERTIACSSKSACKSADEGGSHVLAAMGRDENESGVRFTMGRETTKQDIEYTVDALCDILKKYKKL